MMVDHLRDEGYDRIPIKETLEPTVFMLTVEAETALNTFIHSSHADFPAPNEKVATFLRDQEETFGPSIVARQDAERYAAAFSFLIQLLCEYADDLETVVGSVVLTPRRNEKLE